MSEALLALLRLNLAAAAAVLAVMVLRRPIRRLFGAEVAYGLWALVPLAAASMLAPARVVTITPPGLAMATQAVTAAARSGIEAPLRSGPDIATMLIVLWLAGALAALARLSWRQVQFSRAAKMGHAGPAVVGILRPRIVTPDDFAQRYTPREQQVILAHETTHIARHDSRINALVALARCANWFNPLVHLLAHALRIDQELACDARVMATHPTARRSYAEAMLKTQLAAHAAPLGCHWRAQASHPLAERIGLLSQRPSRTARRIGRPLIALLAFSGAYAAWAARPPEIVLAPSPARHQAGTSQTPTEAAPAVTAAPITRQTMKKVSPPLPPVSKTLPAAAAPAQASGEGATAADGELLPAGFDRRSAHGPKVWAIAGWSAVEPGSAVRVVATMIDPDGVPLTTDLTAFGSQSRYRVGYVWRNASHYKLFTTVAQHGDRLLVTAGLNRRLEPQVSGSIDLASGETGTIRLGNGQLVTVTPTLRPETADEIATGRQQASRPFTRPDRFEAL